MLIYSQISSNIGFDELNDSEKVEVITRTYENVTSNLDSEGVKIVEELKVKDWFIDHASN